jgi:hypothetical protein
MAIDDKGREQVMQIAQNLLGKQIGALDAVRAIVPLLQLDPTLVSREDRKTIIEIARETADLPVGRIREVWHPDILLEKDKEIEKYEGRYGETVRSICERLVRRHRQETVKYVGLPDFHDGNVRSVSQENGAVRVTVEGDTGRRYVVRFDGVMAVEMSSPEDMGIYALSEAPSDVEGVRVYDFINWKGNEPEPSGSKAYLRIFATDFSVQAI